MKVKNGHFDLDAVYKHVRHRCLSLKWPGTQIVQIVHMKTDINRRLKTRQCHESSDILRKNTSYHRLIEWLMSEYVEKSCGPGVNLKILRPCDPRGRAAAATLRPQGPSSGRDPAPNEEKYHCTCGSCRPLQPCEADVTGCSSWNLCL